MMASPNKVHDRNLLNPVVRITRLCSSQIAMLKFKKKQVSKAAYKCIQKNPSLISDLSDYELAENRSSPELGVNVSPLSSEGGVAAATCRTKLKRRLFDDLESQSSEAEQNLSDRNLNRRSEHPIFKRRTCDSLAYPKLPPHLQRYQYLLPQIAIKKYTEDAESTVLSAEGGRKTRRYFCPFCMKDIARLPRHVEALHKQELLVSKMLMLPRDHPERLDIISAIRLWGIAIFNGDRSINNGTVRVYRRPSGRVKKDASSYVPCANCGRLIFRRRCGHHYQRCIGAKFQSRTYSHIARGAAYSMNIHSDADNLLRNRIFPHLRDDTCVKIIRYDEAIIAYANNVTRKYCNSHHHDKMIRANIRMLGRILVAARDISEGVTDFASLILPSMVDVIRLAVNNISGFQESEGIFTNPASALHAARLVKDVATTWKARCIAMNNAIRVENTDNFISLFSSSLFPVISRLVIEDRTLHQRTKKLVLPSLSDMQLLMSYIKNNYKKSVKKLEISYNYKVWLQLGTYILLYLIIYNRRRPGEVERIYLSNLDSLIGLDANNPLYNTLTVDEKSKADRIKLFVIRGKLNRTVNVLITKSLHHALQIFIKFREKAGISNDNPYLFALPNLPHEESFKHLDASKNIRLASIQCGAKDPSLLRTTVMRKSFATHAATLSKTNINDVADHMGHASTIHKNIYRQATYERSILGVASALESAAGGHISSDESDEEVPASRASNFTRLPMSELTPPRVCGLTPQPTREYTSVLSTSENSASPLAPDLPSTEHDPLVNDESVVYQPSHNEKNLQSPKRSWKRIKTLQSTPKIHKYNRNARKDPVSKIVSNMGRAYSRRELTSPSSTSSSPLHHAKDTSSQRLTDKEEVAFIKYYSKNGLAFKSQLMTTDLETALRLPELRNVSLPALKMYVNNMRRPQGTPVKHRYVDSQQSSPIRTYKSREATRKIRWSEEAKDLLIRLFHKYIYTGSRKLPSKKEIEETMFQYPVLQQWKYPAIKVAISNFRKKFDSGILL